MKFRLSNFSPLLFRSIFSLCIIGSVITESNAQLEITHLEGDFYIFTTYRSFNGIPFPSNGMYVVTRDGILMIDTPWDTTQFQPFMDSVIARHHQQIAVCIATHAHEDRTGGLEFFKENQVKTYTTKLTDEISKRKKENRATYLIQDDTTFRVGQYRFETFYPGPGHTKDNIVIWFPDQRILYAGCFVKSTDANDLGNITEADLIRWPASLTKTIEKFPHAKYVIPGHQGWSGTNSLSHTLDLLTRTKKKN